MVTYAVYLDTTVDLDSNEESIVSIVRVGTTIDSTIDSLLTHY